MKNATTLLLRTALEKHRKSYTRLQSALRKGRFHCLNAAQKTQWLHRLTRYETRLQQWGLAAAIGGAALLLPTTGQAQSVPAGTEFRVNTWTTNDQFIQAIAMDSNGDFVVAWTSSGQDGSTYGVYAQRYSNAGLPQGAEFRVNTYTTMTQSYPAIAMDSDGDFVVTWDSYMQDGSGYAIYAQRYNSAGVAQGSEFRVNTWTTSDQVFSAIDVDSDSDFVVTWASDQDGSGFGIYAQRYNSTGVAQGSEFRVNTWTTLTQILPAIAMDDDGNFVITWQSSGQDSGGNGIYAQRYNNAGVPQGSEFRVNTWTTSAQSSPAIAMDSDGDFVVAWQSLGQDGNNYGIYAQRYNSTGTPQGAEFRVNTWTTSAQGNPTIAMDNDGNFVVSWESSGQDGSNYGVYAQRYNSAGVAQGTEFRINTWTTVYQNNPAIAMDSDGDFVITWQSNLQDGNNYGIYAQRYHNPAFPVELTTFRGEATDSGNLLEWTTASEKDNEGFDVERSNDGRNFETVGFVPGGGTVQEPREYRFTDQPPAPGIHYYRLRQTDFGGSYTYSDIIVIASGHEKPALAAYPNPAGDVLYIAFATADGALYNALGQPMLFFSASLETTTLEISHLPAGMYWVESVGQQMAVVKR